MLFGLGADLACIILGANVNHARRNAARVHKRPAHKHIPGLFGNKVAFTRKQALVHVAFARNNFAVRGNLHATSQANHIIANHLVKLDFLTHAITNNGSMRACNDRQLISNRFRAQLLNDANKNVHDNNNHEQHVLVRTGKENDNGKNQIHCVEQRDQVVEKNLLDRARMHVRIYVHIARSNALLHLFAGQTRYLFH